MSVRIIFMTRLRPNQLTLKQDVYSAWRGGARNVLAVLPTGGGKTVVLADIIREFGSGVAAIAHRSELVTQISLALAREGVRHRIIGPDSLRRQCVQLHMLELNRNLHDPGAKVGVAGIDTLVRRDISQDSWFRNVGLWACDESHHLQAGNKWGRGIEMFPNAWGLGLTATPVRADGGGLSASSDGVFHAMAVGPSARELINAGYLTDYRIFAPPSDVDYSEVNVTAAGDLSGAKLRAAVHASNTIVGDVVKHYLRIARGKLGITFTVDVEAAGEIARAYRAAGVPAEVVSAETDPLLRAHILRKFKNREVMNLVNVDLFGEGFDLPAIEVVSMVRKTESFPLFCQQFGRALRLMISPQQTDIWDDLTPEERRAQIAASSKPNAIIIDHVGNVIRHGLPDAAREWSMDRRERRSAGPTDAIPLRSCANPVGPCAGVYERYLKVCPYCGFYPEPVQRTSPEQVDGDLFELDPSTLATLRGEVDRIDGAPYIPHSLSAMAVRGLQNAHHERQVAQHALRSAIALWAGWKRDNGHDDSQSYRMFYHRYGVDVLTAKALGRREATELKDRIDAELTKNGVTRL